MLSLARGPYLKEPNPELDLNLAVPVLASLQKIFILLRARTGHDFSLYKASTLRRRIARRMNIHQIHDHKGYIRYLEENVQEADLLFKELLIGVTGFFRDPDAFAALCKLALPQLISATADGGSLRVWVPGCSTGEEAYSIAILLRECMDRIKLRVKVQIFATDIDRRAIDAARAGLYPDGIRADVSRDRLQRFFVQEGDFHRISKELRESVIFAEQNLIRDPPFTRLDLVSCRNLLIYLHADMQKRLLPLFHHALRRGGVLYLGNSETIGSCSNLFSVLDRKSKLFQRKEGVSSAARLPVLPALSTVEDLRELRPPPVPLTEHHPSVATLAAGLLSERHAPPSLIVNERGEIIFIHGQTGLYLQPQPGQPTHNVLTMAREGLRVELAAGLRQAARTERAVVHKGLQVKTNGGFVQVDLTVSKIGNPEALRGLLLVAFDAASGSTPAPPAEPRRRGAAQRMRSGREATLERELKVTGDNLRSTIEELETAREELQSLNEELQTVNAELLGKLDELAHANDDMANLFNATDIATVFLDNELRIKSFTAHATDVIRLIPTDVGRPFSDIVSKLRYD